MTQTAPMPETDELAPAGAATEASTTVEPDVIAEDVLVEDVSIDGMCGVY